MAQRVKRAFSFDRGGVPVTLARGGLYADDHPYVKAYPSQFEPADAAARTPVTASETATAAPGMPRSVGRPRKPRATQPVVTPPAAPVDTSVDPVAPVAPVSPVAVDDPDEPKG